MNEAQIEVMEDIEAEVTAEELTVNAVSPRAEITRTESGVDITITDVDGTHTASLYDGQTGPQGPKGEPGVGIPTGGTAGQVLAKASGTDYDTKWVNQSGGGGAVESVNGKTGAVTLTAQDVGAYTMPTGGIPATDLASAVQTSLGKADTALQTETDPTVPEWAKAATKPSYSWNEIEGKPTIPTVPTNVSAFTNDAGYLTQHQDISGKVDEPATEGTSGQVLTTDGQGGRSWTDIEKAPVTVSGATPTINALPGVRYICGEVSTLDITLPASGIIDVVFHSGSTPTVLTVTPPTGMTMKWANGFDPSALEADTTYEINIMDGCLGVAGTWS